MVIVEQVPDLVCPAGSLPALRAAVDNGADAVYIGFSDTTNARNFPGLNFDMDEAHQGVNYAHQNNCKVMLALNTYPQNENWPLWTQALQNASELKLDAVIMADLGLLQYASKNYPELNLHLSVQGSATNQYSIAFYYEQFGVKRVILPRVLSMTQVRNVVAATPIEVEVFGFGSLCVMVEGRCIMSSYVTGESPNTSGVCSPAHAVSWEETPNGRQSRLNNVLIDRYQPGEAAGYPTLCKGRFQSGDDIFYAIEEPTSLNVLEILPELVNIGVAAIKIEGRQRSPAYVAQVTRIFRTALDAYKATPDAYQPAEEWLQQLQRVSEGCSSTLGALHRPWQ